MPNSVGMPGRARESRNRNDKMRNHIGNWSLIGLLAVAELALAAGGCWLYRYCGRFIILFTVLSVLMTGVLAAFVFMYRQRTLYRNLFRAEQVRWAVEEEFRATFYSIGDGVISTDATGHVTRMNPVAEKLTGWIEAEALGQPVAQVFRIVNEESRAEVESPVTRVIREGVTANLANHTLLLSRDGTEHPIADSGAPVCDETGKVIGVVLVFRDQSAERQAEVLLRRSQEQFQSIVKVAQDAIVMIDPQGHISLWNDSAERVLGYSAEEAIGQHLHELLAPARFHEASEKGFAEFQRSGVGAAVGKTLELPALHKDGKEIPVELSLAPVQLDGRWHAVGIVRDITERKKAKEQQARLLGRLEAVNRLREDLLLPASREEKFRNITEAAVRLLDLDFCRIWIVKPSDLCNQGCIHAAATDENHLCRHRDECLHLAASSGRYTHTDGDHRRVPIGLYKIGRIASGEEQKFLTNNVATDPRVHNHKWAKSLGLVAFAGYKLRDSDGKPIGVLAMFAKHPILEEDDAFLCSLAETTSKVIRDSQIQAELREKRKQADLANRSKSQFLANMSHEIRTPMTSILGYTDLLMNDSLDTADRKSFLVTLRRNGEHLLQLINDILDLSKIEAGKMVMELGPCYFPSTIADVASMMRPRAEQRADTLEVHYSGPLPETIHTDNNRIRQVLVNLVGNAVKFTEKGRIRIGVSFSPQWRPDQPAVSVEVEDTGIGIRKEQLPRLFEPFAQADSSTTRKYGGTGLGLAISQRIVEALGGEMTVRSVPGEGSTFTVTIPTGDISGVSLLQSPREAVCDREAKTQWRPSPGMLHGVKILLAEDSLDNQELLRVVLGSVGAEMNVVENGRLAVEQAETADFDVILMDMNMPVMDGYAATRMLRDRGYTRSILALTANAMSGDAERCLSAGCDAHLTKPIDRRHLIETVSHYSVSKTGQTHAAVVSPDEAVPSAQSDGITSQFCHDPVIAGILPAFVERLPGRLDELCKALEEENFEDLQRLAHRLKGAGGSYGYPTLSEMAKSLELAARAGDRDEATTSLASIREVCAAIQIGWTGHHAETAQS